MEQVDIAIIGGGPAGMAAGLYAARGKRKTLLFEGGVLGGQIATTGLVENYPGFPAGIEGPDLAMAMHEQASRFGMETRYEPVTGILRDGDTFVVETDGGQVGARAVIITAGAEHKKLDVPGEAELVGKGVSYCATCDAAFFKEQVVAIVGGGDAALDEALFTTRYASKVYIIHRRDELRASAILQERALNHEKIEFIWDTVVERVNGDREVTSLTIRNLKTAEVRDLPVSAIFVFIGQVPNSGFLGDMVDLDGGGHIVVNLWMETREPGLFAAGDLRIDAARQLGSAAGDGITAAIRAEHYLSEKYG